MITNFHRFKDFTAMTAWVQAHVTAFVGPWEIEAHIYEEGVCHRPGITLFTDYETIFLRWYAYADEPGIDFMGPKQRVEARNAGGDYVNRLIEAVEELA
jgi:hypothetical protein